MNVIDTFNQYSEDYDKNRRLFIPCYDEFYQLAVESLEFKTDTPKILDLGAGTGLLSAFILSKYPKAEITLIDQAENMIQLAQKRFSENKQIHYIIDNFLTHEYTETYDAVVSALAIHHLEDSDKEKLYQKSYSLLNSTGVFMNADQVLSPYPNKEKQIIELWHDFIKSHDISNVEFQRYLKRTSFDKTATLANQLLWLEQSGFKESDCVFKYLNFAVFFATK